MSDLILLLSVVFVISGVVLVAVYEIIMVYVKMKKSKKMPKYNTCDVSKLCDPEDWWECLEVCKKCGKIL